MSEHLSALSLDELASGVGAQPGAAEHVAACADCAAKLGALKASRDTLLASGDAARRLEAVLAKTAAPAPRPRLKLVHVAAIALPLAAGLALLIAAPVKTNDDARLKGAVTVELDDEAGRAVNVATPGQKLTLAVGAAGLPYGAVFAVDAQGAVTVLWPRGETMGAVDKGARVALATLEVTPGDVAVVAVFSKTARPVRELERQLGALATELKASGKSPLDVAVPGETSARARVVVK